ncbi:glycosyltransferase [Bacteroidota bacterium]
MPIIIVIYSIVLIYTVTYTFIITVYASKISPRKNFSKIVKKELPGVSIIIAAKDEVKNLSNLISSLQNINYPADNFEVIIVDDNSIDETFIKANELSDILTNFRVVKPEFKSFEGKRGALAFGISIASFPNILITDADCMPAKDWLVNCGNSINSGYDFIFGIAPFFQSNNLVNKVSCFENFRNTFLSFSAANMGMAYTASARNFGFRKVAFDEIGGYKNTTDTLSGDDNLLLREAIKNNLKIGPMTSAGSFVYSNTKDTFKEYFSQRARHTQTSFHYLNKSKIFLALWHSLNIIFIPLLILSIVNILFLLPFLVKIIFDLSTGLLFQKKLGYKFSIVEIVYLQILYEVFLVVHFFRAKFGKVSWK